MQANPTFDMVPEPPRGISNLATFSLWFGVALVGLTAVHGIFGRTELGQCVWGFLHIMRAMFAALVLASLLNLRPTHEHSLPKALSPILINLFTLCIILFVPFDGLWREAQFSLSRSAYDTVVAWTLDGALTPDDAGWAELPPGYDHITTTGTVQIVQDGSAITVFFPQSDLGTGPAGLFFRSDNDWPRLSAFDLKWRRLHQVSPNWFIGSAPLTSSPPSPL